MSYAPLGRNDPTGAFIARCAEIDEMLARLQALREAHFNVHSDDVHWGHVGDVSEVARRLRSALSAADPTYDEEAP